MTTDQKSTLATVIDTVRFYLTALSVLVACFSSFAFLFLVPFVIDPAFSTLFAEFIEDPILCVTTRAEFKIGMLNCTWSSCREGCTREIFKCSQIYVNYKIVDPMESLSRGNFTNQSRIQEMEWDYKDAKLYPNVKGCGYPPEVNCTIFNRTFSTVGATFPCYHSNLKPEIALTDLNIEKVKLDLIYAIAIPWSLFLGSILYLLITYVGMSQPDPNADEPQEVSSTKASKDASNYSLRSIGKSLNHGMNKLRGEPDDKGEKKRKGRPTGTEALRRKPTLKT
uniref:Protein tipE n=1 Tax=Hirondellea gigas TaxID=1518452 RepID=A0A6A7G683_9CRUS